MRRSSPLTLFLCAALVVKTSRGFAEGDDVSYRHEFYREDDHRMKVDTDSASFDIGLGPHVRLTGEYVYDAISGATPTGAPPQSKWPFPSFGQDVNQYYLSVYNDPNNLILYNSGYFNSYHDYTNYVALNTPFIGANATNYAKQVYGALTNSPSYRNTHVPLTELHDKRRAFSMSAPITFGIHQFTPELSYSKESDYRSAGLALKYAVLLNNKNTTLNAGWSRNADRVRDDQFVWQRKVSDDFMVGVTQLLTPKSYFTVDLTYAQEFGYLSDPYRGVMAEENLPQPNPEDAVLIPEVRPGHRTKEIVFGSFTQFIEPLHGSAEVSYRFFHDSYGIFAHTAELAWHQKIGRALVLTPAFRYYNQTAADFYYELVQDYNNLPPVYSADYRLSALQTFNLSANLSYRPCKYFMIDVGYSRYIMQGLDGVTSASAYPSANVYTIGGRILF
jgi:hypothetical protein